MSRIGKHPVSVPEGVNVDVQGQEIKAKGKLGELSMSVCSEVSASVEDGKIVVAPKSRSRHARNMWATTRTLVNNIIVGVSEGYSKNLIITGVGYRAAMQGKDLVLQLGFSHEVRYVVPEGIDIKCTKPTEITISGMDKQTVGQVAAEIRSFRPPEPYKGKGVRVDGEYVIRKEGKKK